MEFYSKNASQLFEQYESVSFKTVHQDWLNLLPNNGAVLDVGCGSGRDAAWLAQNNLRVTAVDPAIELLNLAKSNHTSQKITWLNDSLPSLTNVILTGKQYDLILLSAVWMHLTSLERQQSLPVLKALLVDGGKLIITLRHGGFSDTRIAYPLSIKEVKVLSNLVGLTILHETPLNDDELGREYVQWQTIVLGN